jgi:hypothetical protein
MKIAIFRWLCGLFTGIWFCNRDKDSILFSQAIGSNDSIKWIDVIIDELKSMDKNKV